MKLLPSAFRGFFWILRFVVFVLFFVFAIQNTGQVTVHAFLGYTWTAPLVVLLLLVFVVGALLGLVVNTVRYMRLRREMITLRQQLHYYKSMTISKPPRDAL